MVCFNRKKDGSLILKVTTDKKFNILSQEIIESENKESIDYTPLAAFFAEKYLESNKAKVETDEK